MRAPRFSSACRLRAWRTRLVAAGPSACAGGARAAGAILLALGVALRGIAGPVPNGHFASSVAIGMGADNMWRWHILLPLIGYHAHFAGTASAYMHHPLGVFWDMALLGKLFGFSDWVVRLPPVLYVTATPYFLWRIGREIWGPIEGGLCALAYV